MNNMKSGITVIDCKDLVKLMASNDEINDGRCWPSPFYFIVQSKDAGKQFQKELDAIGLPTGSLSEYPGDTDEWLVSINLNFKEDIDLNAAVKSISMFARAHYAYPDR